MQVGSAGAAEEPAKRPKVCKRQAVVSEADSGAVAEAMFVHTSSVGGFFVSSGKRWPRQIVAHA